jgi:hypothetical protein
MPFVTYFMAQYLHLRGETESQFLMIVKMTFLNIPARSRFFIVKYVIRHVEYLEDMLNRKHG